MATAHDHAGRTVSIRRRSQTAARVVSGREWDLGMLTRLRVAFPVVAVLAAVLLVLPAGPAAAAAAPTLRLSSTVVVPGTKILVEGSGWSRGTTLQAVVCGADDTGGSYDCAESSASAFSPWSTGQLEGVLVVEKPPVGCPCVVQVTGITAGTQATFKLPLTIVGDPVRPIPPVPVVGETANLSASATVTSRSSLATDFGASAPRTLVVTIHNRGTGVVQTVLSARWGSPSDANNVITTDDSIQLLPGQTRTVSFPFSLRALSLGSYSVTGQLSGATLPVSFSTSTSTWPWALIVAIVLAVLALVGLFIWARRRKQRKDLARELGDGAHVGLAAMTPTVPIATAGPGRIRWEHVWLLGQADGATTAVPLGMLTIDAEGVGIVDASTQERRVVPWGSVVGFRVERWKGQLGSAGGAASAGSAVVVMTQQAAYQFALPGSDPDDLRFRLRGFVERLAPAGIPAGQGPSVG